MSENAFKYSVLASGSTGNSFYVETPQKRLLIDAGLTGKKITSLLADIDRKPEDLDAILITHEHSDHIRSVRVVNKKLSHIKTYANGATWQCIDCQLDETRREVISSGEEFFVGGIEIVPFSTSHDAADSIGYTFRKEGKIKGNYRLPCYV